LHGFGTFEVDLPGDSRLRVLAVSCLEEPMSTSIYISDRNGRWGRRRLRRARRGGRPLVIAARWGLLLASLAAALVLGLATQLYEGAYSGWVARELCGVPYALAWCFGLALLRPTARPAWLAAWAVSLCCAIEGLQLWHPHLLEVARATELGRLALGSGFSWLDMPWYAVGGAVGWAWLRLLPFRRPGGGAQSVEFERPMGVRP
jgi:hypothetical protein